MTAGETQQRIERPGARALAPQRVEDVEDDRVAGEPALGAQGSRDLAGRAVAAVPGQPGAHPVEQARDRHPRPSA